LTLERMVQAFLREAIAADLVRSAHDFSDGGLAVAAAECCMASGLGAHLEIPASDARMDRLLFAEGGARILVSVSPANTVAWQQALDRSGVPGQCLGVVAGEAELQIQQASQMVLQLPVAQMSDRFEQAIPRRMGVDLPPTA
jgi:phosphoribosylformylglycinamidine synthase